MILNALELNKSICRCWSLLSSRWCYDPSHLLQDFMHVLHNIYSSCYQVKPECKPSSTVTIHSKSRLLMLLSTLLFWLMSGERTLVSTKAMCTTWGTFTVVAHGTTVSVLLLYGLYQLFSTLIHTVHSISPQLIKTSW